jgi:hypothetical protein
MPTDTAPQPIEYPPPTLAGEGNEDIRAVANVTPDLEREYVEVKT